MGSDVVGGSQRWRVCRGEACFSEEVTFARVPAREFIGIRTFTMIEIDSLCKRHKHIPILENFSLELEAGDIFGLIGPNGSGKTVLLRILATLEKPTEGSAKVAGYDVQKDAGKVRRLVGYVPEVVEGYDDLLVWEYLVFFAGAHRMPKQERVSAIDGVLDLTDLTAVRDDYIKSLSRGLKQRLCIAKALLIDPAVFLLDEPMTGLDLRGRIVLWELLKELSAMGKTIVIASNMLAETVDICNKIGIIDGGKLLFSGDVNSALSHAGVKRVIEVKVLSEAETAKDVLAKREEIVDVNVMGDRLLAEYVGNPEGIYEVLNALIYAGIKVLAFQEDARGIENLFLKIISKSQ